MAITYRLIPTLSYREIREAAEFILRHSWGEGYKLDFAIEVLQRADAVFKAILDEKKIVGTALVTRFHGHSSFGVDARPFLVGWVVRRDLQKQGIGTILYGRCVRHAMSASHRHGAKLFATTYTDEQRDVLRHVHAKVFPKHAPWIYMNCGFEEYGDQHRLHVFTMGR
jgi:GNAT superfamily N-acetyltransferase